MKETCYYTDYQVRYVLIKLITLNSVKLWSIRIAAEIRQRTMKNNKARAMKKKLHIMCAFDWMCCEWFSPIEQKVRILPVVYIVR